MSKHLDRALQAEGAAIDHQVSNILKSRHLNFYRSFAVVMQVLLLISAFLFIVYQNSFLAQNWWVLALRDIDDLAMNQSTQLMRNAIEAGDWMRFFSFFDYAYGFGFWLLMVLITSPAEFFNSPELQILIGRNGSLLAVFATSITVALIGRRVFPDKKRMWLVVCAMGFLTPISLINATKMHVNAWVTFFGALAILVILLQPRLKTLALILGSILIGVSIGFKLTGLTLVPVFLSVVFYRRREVWLRSIALSGTIVFLSAIASGAPILLAIPIFPESFSQIAGTFSLFGNMASGIGWTPEYRLISGMGFYGSPVVLLISIVLFIPLFLRSGKWIAGEIQSFFSLAIALTLISSWVLASILVDKSDIYIATYLSSITSFLPLGLLGLTALTPRVWLQIFLGWGLVFTNLITGPQFMGAFMGAYNYASLASSDSVQRKVEAAQDIDALLSRDSSNIKVLVDVRSVFPRSNIDQSASITINYGNLEEYRSGGVAFDYIVLDKDNYYGKPNPVEEAARNDLLESGTLGVHKYSLVYTGNGTLLFRLSGP